MFYFIFHSLKRHRNRDIFIAQTMDGQRFLCHLMFFLFSIFFFFLTLCIHPFILHIITLTRTLSVFSLSALFTPSFSLAGSGLQDGLELSGHADVLLLLTDDALDGWWQATGVPGEDEGIAVLAAAVLFQGAAGVGDGVVVIVGVDHPIVVTWLDKKK